MHQLLHILARHGRDVTLGSPEQRFRLPAEPRDLRGSVRGLGAHLFLSTQAEVKVKVNVERTSNSFILNLSLSLNLPFMPSHLFHGQQNSAWLRRFLLKSTAIE